MRRGEGLLLDTDQHQPTPRNNPQKWRPQLKHGRSEKSRNVILSHFTCSLLTVVQQKAERDFRVNIMLIHITRKKSYIFFPKILPSKLWKVVMTDTFIR